MVLKTALYQSHLEHHAKMVDFHGWEMPLHYGSQIKEHQAVRENIGLFDVSHMNVVDILGAGARQFLRHLLTNDVDALPHSGAAMYSCMCNEHGRVIDDLIVYQRSSDNYRLILNSATRDKDLNWLNQHIEGFSAGIQEQRDLSMLAVQGPQALTVLQSVLAPAQADAISTLMPFECVDVTDWFFARTGYTGEDGLEIVLPSDAIEIFWKKLIDAGVQPCGLAARDTLRLEAGLMLYGQDMNESITPLEAGLGWTVRWQPESRSFIGKGALLSQKELGIKRKLVGLILDENGIMRSGQSVLHGEQTIGEITSGSFAPTLGKSIAFAYIPTHIKENVVVSIRGKKIPVRITKPRFVKNGKPIE